MPSTVAARPVRRAAEETDPRPVDAVLAAAMAVLVSVAAYLRVDEGLPTTYLVSYDLLTDIALVAAAIALGVSVRSRRELRAHQERLRALAAAEERHEAAEALGHDDEAAARALEQIRSAASATLRELRSTVKLQGMAERAGLLGGTLTAGTRDGGGFEVRATLPRRLGA